LLARGITVPLAKSKPAIAVEAPTPAHMLTALALCGFAGDPPPKSDDIVAALTPSEAL